VTTDFKTFEDLANAIGAVPALKLCAFFASIPSLYVPKTYIINHPIEHLIGIESFKHLIQAYGNKILKLPTLELLNLRRAGRLYQLNKLGASTALSAQLLGIGTRQVNQIKSQLATFEQSLFSEEA
jgi:hypothetical protein